MGIVLWLQLAVVVVEMDQLCWYFSIFGWEFVIIFQKFVHGVRSLLDGRV